MGIVEKDPVFMTGSMAEEIVRTIRSEPALAWFLAQALWITQPALEIFWSQEKITAIADLLESRADSTSGGEPPHPCEEDGTRKTNG
jgi:hypothetical protein